MTVLGNKKRNLGRGLSALLGEDAKRPNNIVGGRVLKMLPIEHLRPGEYQPRNKMDSGEILELSKSISEKGILQPLLVRSIDDTNDPNVYEIIAGERRWRAAQIAKLHQVPVIIKDLNNQETLEIALIENLQRKDLSPLEEAMGYERLMREYSYTQEVLAQSMGKSRSHVANTLRLLLLPSSVKGLIDEGRLSAGHARALLGAAKVENLAKVVLKQGLNVRQTEELVKKSNATVKTKVLLKNVKDPDTLALEQNISDFLGLKVDISFKNGRGALKINYNDLSQLDDLILRLTREPGE